MKTDIQVELNENEFRQLVKEELVRESVREMLLKEGFSPEVVEQTLNELGWRDLKALVNTVGGSAKKAKDALVRKAGDLSDEALEQASAAIDSIASAGGEVVDAGKKVKQDVTDKYGEEKAKVNKAFQANYRKSFTADIEKTFENISKKYFNDKVLAKAGYDEDEMLSLKDKMSQYRSEFGTFLDFSKE